jgi:ABC-2 type transport system permease protein
MLGRFAAFLRRALAVRRVYASALVMDAGAVIVIALTLYFLGTLVDTTGHARLGSGYFSFALTGVAMAMLLQRGVRGFSDTVRRGQLDGTLEALFAQPMRDWEVVTWDGVLHFIGAAARLALYAIAGMLLGAPLANANWLATFVVIVLAVLAFCPIGLIAAAVTLLWYRDPVTLVVSVASTLLAGVYYPVEVLPLPLRALSQAIPLTHALGALRGALFDGRSLLDLWWPILVLSAFTLVFGPISAAVFSAAARRARRLGTLSRY